jgi:hypothetical protein
MKASCRGTDSWPCWILETVTGDFPCRDDAAGIHCNPDWQNQQDSPEVSHVWQIGIERIQNPVCAAGVAMLLAALSNLLPS